MIGSAVKQKMQTLPCGSPGHIRNNPIAHQEQLRIGQRYKEISDLQPSSPLGGLSDAFAQSLLLHLQLRLASLVTVRIMRTSILHRKPAYNRAATEMEGSSIWSLLPHGCAIQLRKYTDRSFYR